MMSGMTMAKASADDFGRFWSIHRAQQRLEQADWTGDGDTRERRCRAIILGRLDQLGGGFVRVVMGCEMLIKGCCHPFLDHLAYKPALGAASEMLEALRAAEARLALHREELFICSRNPATHKVDDEADQALLHEEDAMLAQVRSAIAHATGDAA
jgi:hypothetical protein